MSNMSYCRFENTSIDMQDLIDVMYEEGFNPSTLSRSEKRSYDALYDQCQSIMAMIEELEERDYLEAKEIEDREQYEEDCAEELEMHRSVAGYDDKFKLEDL